MTMLTTDELARLRATLDEVHTGLDMPQWYTRAVLLLDALPELLRVYEAVLAAPKDRELRGVITADCGDRLLIELDEDRHPYLGGERCRVLVPLATAKGESNG